MNITLSNTSFREGYLYRLLYTFCLIAVSLATLPTAALAADKGQEHHFLPQAPWELGRVGRQCAIARSLVDTEGRVFRLELRSRGKNATWFYAALMSDAVSLRLGPEAEGVWSGTTKDRLGPSPIVPRMSFRTSGGMAGFATSLSLPESAGWRDDLPAGLVERARKGDKDAQQAFRDAYNRRDEQTILRLPGIDTLTLTNAEDEQIVLGLGALDKPVAALHACIDEMRDEEIARGEPKQSALAFDNLPLVTGELAALGRKSGYTSGTFGFQVSVDEKGRPYDCFSHGFTPSEEFDKAVCDVFIKYGRYTPARDAAGRREISYFATTVNF